MANTDGLLTSAAEGETWCLVCQGGERGQLVISAIYHSPLSTQWNTILTIGPLWEPPAATPIFTKHQGISKQWNSHHIY